MITPTFGVTCCSTNLNVRAAIGKPRRCKQVVDAPTHVVVERLTTVAPPRVRTFYVSESASVEIDPTMLIEPGVEIRTLLWKEAGRLLIATPILEIHLAVCDVEVADHQRLYSSFLMRAHALGHHVQEAVFLCLLLFQLSIAGWDVNGSNDYRTIGMLHGCFCPPTLVRKLTFAKADDDVAQWVLGDDRRPSMAELR